MMTPFRAPSETDIKRMNQTQAAFFGELTDIFDPPLPEGVPQRLETIVESAQMKEGDVVLDVGAGTGILVPFIQAYMPDKVFACDLSEKMLARLKEHYPFVETYASDVRDLRLADSRVDVVFLNACYPNIADKQGSFQNITRMMKKGGRMVISHPLGKSFIDSLREKSPFPLDSFPDRNEAETLFLPHQFDIQTFIDEPELYILVATKRVEAA